MSNNTILSGQDVWITGGLDKGKKGTVIGSGWGVYQVQLDAETKTYDQHSVSLENPTSHNVPLPPNFLPLEHKVGDKVIVEGFHMWQYNGVVGTVERVPNSVVTFGFEGRAYRIKAAKNSKYPDAALDFLPKFLKPYKAVRVEGEEIGHEDVRIGDTIRVELRSRLGGYSQLSSKSGKVGSISTKLVTNLAPYEHYQFRTSEDEGRYLLNYGTKGEKIFLEKAAEDPYVQILKDLGKGTVVVFEKDSGEVLTYVKSVPWGSTTQWHEITSGSGRSSCFVTEEDIVNLLSRDVAEIVYKVRKKK